MQTKKNFLDRFNCDSLNSLLCTQEGIKSFFSVNNDTADVEYSEDCSAINN